MIELSAILSLILVVVITIYFLKREKKSQDKVHLKNLDNEQLHHPKTGTKYTLDQIEAENFEFENYNRIKSDEEIEANYIEEEIDVEKSRNYLRKKGYKRIEPSENPQQATFENLPWWLNYEEVQIDTIVKINKFSYIYFVDLTYQVNGHKGRLDTFSEIQLVFGLKKGNEQINCLTKLSDIDSIEIDNYHFFKLNKIATVDNVKTLLDC